MRSIFLHTRSHTDTYGNSYFASHVRIDGYTAFYLPKQYGYETADEYALFEELQKRNMTTYESLSDLKANVDFYRVRENTTKKLMMNMDYWAKVERSQK